MQSLQAFGIPGSSFLVCGVLFCPGSSPTIFLLPQLYVFRERDETTPGQLLTQKFE